MAQRDPVFDLLYGRGRKLPRIPAGGNERGEGARPFTQRQEIEISLEEQGIPLDPDTLRAFFTSNFIQRTWATLFGLDASNRVQPVRVGPTGLVQTSAFPAEFSDVEVDTLADGAGLPDTTVFANAFREIELFILGDDILLELQKPDLSFTAQVFVRQGFYIRAFSGVQVRVRGATPAAYTVEVAAWR